MNIQEIESHLKKYSKSSRLPVNEREEKRKFLEDRIIPKFCYNSNIQISPNRSIHFELFYEAKSILDNILFKYKSFDDYIKFSFGEKLTTTAVEEKVNNYLLTRKLSEIITVKYEKNLSCSAQLSSVGFQRRLNKPECRRYNLFINLRHDNVFLRENGIYCLLDHEIETHFIRAYNEGFQPWYANRKKFNLSNTTTYENKQIEEGLASINTILAANDNSLGISALLYYATCMSYFLTFDQLFDHLRKYIKSEDYRWKQCVRIKKNLDSVNDLGGYSKDQSYFEGAYYLLSNLRNIDFELLHSGKLTVRDLVRINRIVRRQVCRLPKFLINVDLYRQRLLKIAKYNNIHVLSSTVRSNSINSQISKLKDTNLSVSPNQIQKPLKVSHFLMMKKKQNIAKQSKNKSDHFLPNLN